ncbi:PLP-dependent aminotransferase family protein [Pendulispora albinea]|uniref:PLP-dependent aminotransferase family protein n=1 Tax=Pendulispora albinea TaxID=2741071 RepID=A0ABZ2M9Z5_9BACT
MRARFTLELPESTLPLFLRIAHAITDSIRSGRLREGEDLPSTRALSNQLGVHRKTVVAAYAELRAQGLVISERARGTFVARDLPPSPPARRALPFSEHPGFHLPSLAAPFTGTPRAPGTLLLLGGVPELRITWRRELARAYGRALGRSDAARLLDYGDPRGEPHLRQALADLVRRTRGVPAPMDGVVVVRGALQGLYLAARALLRAGDCVAVEELSHPSAIRVLRLVGARVEPLPLDAQGLDVEALGALCARMAVRAVYLTPHHQLPTTVTLTPPRRKKLLELASRHALVVLEDDYDHEFHYDGRPTLPLAAADRAGVVVYLGTFSKVLAPGLRVGFVVAPPAVARQLADYRTFVDQQGDHVLERAVADLIEEGDLERFIRRARRVYQARRDVLCEALHAAIPGLELVRPVGGMAAWVRAPGVDTDIWAERAYAAGAAFQPGSIFGVNEAPAHYARVGFAACNTRELVEGVRRMALALPR